MTWNTLSREACIEMRLAAPLVVSVVIGMLGCTRGDSSVGLRDIAAPAPNELGRHAMDSRIGKWVSAEESPLGMIFILKSDGTFSLGDIENGEEYPDGLTGTWTTEDGDRLRLVVETSESCKISEGSELNFTATVRKDGREMVALERIFVRANETPNPE